MDFNNQIEVASRLQEILRNNKIEQKDLAKEMGIHEVSLCRKIKNPDGFTIGELRKIQIFFKKKNLIER